MNAIAMSAGALLFLAGMGVGRWWPARRRSPKPVEPICGCSHHHSFHDPQTGACHSPVFVPGTMSRGSHYESCTCRQYAGPTPLPEFYAPEVTA